MPIWLTIGVAALAAVTGAFAVFVLLTWLLNVPVRVTASGPHGVDQRRVLVEVFKAALGLAAGLGAVVALALNYRRHRIEQSQSHRDDQRLFTERFESAAEQLGRRQPAIRLAGVHALTRLADDWEEQRQTCIDVLCAYVRLPAVGAPEDTGDAAARTPVTPRAEREVRQTILRLVGEHLCVEPKDPSRVSWQSYDFDFTGAVFDGAISFDSATFAGKKVSFTDATFADTVDFAGATFCGGYVAFDGARLLGSTVSFDGAKFNGDWVIFDGVTFAQGLVSFGGAEFMHGTVSFDDASFSGGLVSFRRAELLDGIISFNRAVFSDGIVTFNGADFDGTTLRLDEARFSGGVLDLRETTGCHPPQLHESVASSGLLLPSDERDVTR